MSSRATLSKLLLNFLDVAVDDGDAFADSMVLPEIDVPAVVTVSGVLPLLRYLVGVVGDVPFPFGVLGGAATPAGEALLLLVCLVDLPFAAFGLFDWSVRVFDVLP